MQKNLLELLKYKKKSNKKIYQKTKMKKTTILPSQMLMYQVSKKTQKISNISKQMKKMK